MAFGYPVSLDVTGRRCLVVGGSALAEQRVRGLLDAGADVHVVAEAATPGLEELARRGQVTLTRRAFEEADTTGVLLAVAVTDTEAVFAACTAAGVLCNALDEPDRCHFAFPSVIRRGDLVVSIGTSGRAPAFAKRLRRDLEAAVGPEYGVLVDLLAEARADLAPQRSGMGFEEWAGRWAAALEADLVGLVREGRLDDVRALVHDTISGRRPVAAQKEAAL